MLRCLLPLWLATAVPLQPPAVDLSGEPLPPGAIARLGSVRFVHQGPVFGAAFAPDAKTIATGDYTGTLRLWNAATGKALWQQAVTKDYWRAATPVLFTPDGKLLLAPSEKGVCVWEAATGKELRRIGSAFFNRLALSPDGTVLAGGRYTGSTPHLKADVYLWDVATGKELGRLTGHDNCITALSFSVDGRWLAASNFMDIRVWDVATKQQVHLLTCREHEVHSLQFLADGKTLICNCGTFRLMSWDVATGKELGIRGSGCANFVVSPDGKLLASTWGAAYAVDVKTLNGVYGFPGHQGTIGCAAFSRDGKLLATGGYDGTLCLWNMANGKPVLHNGGHTGHVSAVAFLGDNQTIATASWDKTVRLWEVRTGKQLGRHAHAGAILSNPEPSAPYGTREAMSFAFAPGGDMFADGSAVDVNGAAVCLRDVDGAKKLHEWKSEYNCGGLQFSADGKCLGASNYQTICLWDAVTGQERYRLPTNRKSGYLFAIAPNAATLALQSDDGNHIELIEVATRKVLGRLAWPGKELLRLTFSPSGRYLAASGSLKEKTVLVWDLQTKKTLLLVHDDNGPYAALAFAPDSKRLAAAGSGSSAKPTVLVWNVESGQVVSRFQGHAATVWALAFSGDGKHLASASGDRTVLVWDVAK